MRNLRREHQGERSPREREGHGGSSAPPWLESVFSDIRFGLRMLRKSPGFTTVAVLTLALGIGANTAIFGAVDAVLLRPLPFPEANNTVFVRQGIPGKVVYYDSWQDFLDWHSQLHVFSLMGAYQPQAFYLPRAGRPPQPLSGIWVTNDVFRLLAVKPFLGRVFGDADQKVGAPPAVVVSHRFWKDFLHSDDRAVGHALELEGTFLGAKGGVDRRRTFTIVGVLPPKVEFPGEDFDLFLPLGQELVQPLLANRATRPILVIARLRRGVSLDNAQSEMDALTEHLDREYPAADKGIRTVLTPAHEQLVGKEARETLLLLQAAAALVLLLACANIAHMALARGVARRREFAVRAALGARRGQLVRQLLVEHGLLALLGGAVGVGAAVAGVRALVGVYPEDVFRLDTARVGGSALLFALGACVLATLLFGLAPAAEAQRASPVSSLKEGGGRTAGPGRGAFRSTLFVTEVALAVVMAVGAGLLLRSVWMAMQVNLGFNPNHLLELRLGVRDLPQHTSPAAAMSFYEESLDRLRHLPGVVDTGLVLAPPLSRPFWISPYAVGSAPPGGAAPWTAINLVTDGYFRTMQTSLMAGSFFSPVQWAGGEPVAIVNQTMARSVTPNGAAVGKQIYVRYAFPHPVLQIVGVVGDMKHASPVLPPGPEVFLPAASNPQLLAFEATPTVVVRTKVDPRSLEGAAVQAIHAVDSEEFISHVTAFQDARTTSMARQRFLAALLSVFSGLGLALAIVGISGAMAYEVAQRTQEIGLRMALGARPSDVLRLVLRRGILLTTVGVALGVLGALAFARLLRSELFGVKATDPATLAVAAILIAVSALVSSWVPAQRAAGVDPAEALRQE